MTNNSSQFLAVGTPTLQANRYLLHYYETHLGHCFIFGLQPFNPNKINFPKYHLKHQLTEFVQMFYVHFPRVL